MQMKNVAFIVVLLATICTVLARDHHHHHRHHHVQAPAPTPGSIYHFQGPSPAPGPSYDHFHGPAPAPGPSSDAVSLGSILGASLFSYVAYYLSIHA